MQTFDDYTSYRIEGGSLRDLNYRYIIARTWCFANLPEISYDRNIIYYFSNKLKDGGYILYFHKDIIEYYIQFKLMGF